MFAGRFSSSIGLLGIDFGARGVKLLQVSERNGKLQVVGAARFSKPAGGWGAHAPDLLVQQLRAAFTSGGFTGRRCVVSLPRTDVCVQSIRLPKMPDDELRQAALWESADRFGFPREAMEVDFLRTGASLENGESREEILLAAASHETLSAILEPVLQAGLRPIAVDTHFTALARTFGRQRRRGGDREGVLAVVEVGASASMIMILRGDQIAFCKPIAVGGDHFNKAVAEHLQLDEHAAGELRAARISAAKAPADAGSGTDPATDRAVFEAVRPLMGDLVKEVMLCLRYYGVTFRGHPPRKLLLTGGDGLEPRLDALLAETCNLPVGFDDETETLGGLIEPIRSTLNRSPGPPAWWGVAAGLSLRSLARPRRVMGWHAGPRQHPVDLLPSSIRARSLAGLRTGRYIAACVLGLIIVIAVATASRVRLDRVQHRLEAVRDQANMVMAADEQAAGLRADLGKIHEFIDRYGQIALPLETSRVLATAIRELPASVTLDRIEINAGARRSARSARSRGRDGEEAPPRILTGTLSGFAVSDGEIAALVARLRDIPPFSEVSLDFTRTRVVRGRAAREFGLSFRIDLELAYDVIDGPAPPTAVVEAEVVHVD